MNATSVFYNSVYLRPAFVRDAEALLKIHDPEATKAFAFFQTPPTLEREWIYLLKMTESGSDCLWVVKTADTGKLIGTAGIHEIDRNLLTARLGLIIWNSRFHGKGFGSDTIRALVRYAFIELGLDKVYLTVLVTNVRAQKLYRALGFSDEGVLKGEYVRNGERLDMVRLGMLREEWVKKGACDADYPIIT